MTTGVKRIITEREVPKLLMCDSLKKKKKVTDGEENREKTKGRDL